MANIRTRNWGCALGITLLIAVPVLLAVWLGQVLMTPRTVDDILRAIPLYQGAHNIEYTSVPGNPQDYGYNAVASVDFHVHSTSEEVLKFYEETTEREGWMGTRSVENTLSLHKNNYYFDGVRFGGRAPWIHARQRVATYAAGVIAEEYRTTGRPFSKVTIQVIPLRLNAP